MMEKTTKEERRDAEYAIRQAAFKIQGLSGAFNQEVTGDKVMTDNHLNGISLILEQAADEILKGVDILTCPPATE